MRYTELAKKMIPTDRDVVGACLFIAKQVNLPMSDPDKMTYRAQCRYLEGEFNASPRWLNMISAPKGATIGQYIAAGHIEAGMDLIGNYMDSASNAKSTAELYMSMDDECSIYEFLRKTFDKNLTMDTIQDFYEVDVTEKFEGKWL